jgi:suppressor of G2 allele of SKP1
MADSNANEGAKLDAAAATVTQNAPQAVPAGVPAPAKPRIDWYQSLSHVSVSLMVKDVDATRSSVEVGPRSLKASLLTKAGAAYACNLSLWGEVDAGNHRATYLPSKVEIQLPKAADTPYGNWPALEGLGAIPGAVGGGGAGAAPASSSGGPMSAAAAAAAAGPLPAAPAPAPAAAMPVRPPVADPTQSKPPSAYASRRDWGALERELKAEKDDGDPLQALFHSIYAKADEDTRRAMVKSYVSRS